MKMKLILDMDTGVDDAQAIMVALAAPNVEVLGITCTNGNTSLENVLRNTLRVLKVCNRLDIPVYAGCLKPMIGPQRNAEHYQGEDGLGGVPDPDAPGPELLQKEEAANAIINIVNQNPGEMTIVATAPLTNLAVAVQLCPSISDKLKALYIMGGNTESRGNTTVCGEFNFTADPEAAYIVLDRYTCPTYIAPWEFCCRISLPWAFYDLWLDQGTEKAAFMKKISAFSMRKARSAEHQETTQEKGFISCDTHAVAAALDDAYVTDSEEVAVTVELRGTCTRGMMVLDYMQLLDKKHKAVILKKVDVEKYKQLLMNSLQ